MFFLREVKKEFQMKWIHLFSLDSVIPIKYRGRFLRSNHVFPSFEQNRVTDQEASSNKIQVCTIKLESTKNKKSWSQALEILTPKLQSQWGGSELSELDGYQYLDTHLPLRGWWTSLDLTLMLWSVKSSDTIVVKSMNHGNSNL